MSATPTESDSKEAAAAPNREVTIVGAAGMGLVSAAGSLGFSFVRSKVTALYLGPIGVGLASEVLQLAQMANISVTFFTGAALVSSVSASLVRADFAAVQRSYNSALSISMLLTVVFAVVCAPVAAALLGGYEHHNVALLAAMASLATLGATTVWIPGQILLASGNYRRATGLTLALSVTSSLLTCAGVVVAGLNGQFAGMILAQLLMAVVIWRAAGLSIPEIRWRPRLHFDKTYLRHALTIGSAGIVSGLSMQAALLVVRTTLHERLGTEANGFFQAAWWIGSVTMGTVLNVLGSFAFPKYAAAQTSAELEAEVTRAGDFVVAVAPAFAFAGLLFRREILTLLYSAEFEPAAALMGLMLAADVAKAVGWVQAGPLLYRGKVRGFLITEASATGVLALGAWALTPHWGLLGAGIAYAAMNMVYVPITRWVVQRECGIRIPSRIAVLGLAFSACGFVQGWFVDKVPEVAIACTGAAVAWTLYALRSQSDFYHELINRLGQKIRRRPPTSDV